MDDRSSHRRTVALLLLGLPTVACLAPAEEVPEAEPYTPAVATEEASGGFLLAQLDKSIQRWTELKLGTSAKDQRLLHALELNLVERTTKARDELVDALERGPVLNRQVAAVALGFTRDPTVLSTLLGALADPHPAVVQKALLGLGILADPATPVAEIAWLAQTDPDPWTRNNAAYAMLCLAAAGQHDPELARAARAALIDEEPGVRAQAAGVLGILRDVEAIGALGDLLHDEAALVVQASSTSLARIGGEHLEHKGTVARLLVGALEELDAAPRKHVLGELGKLADQPYGNNLSAWRDWAHRLP